MILKTTSPAAIASSADSANPLTELPLLGGVVKAVNGLLTDIGVPLWLAESFELVGLLVLVYVLLRLFFARGLPWLATTLQPASAWFFDRIAMILLVPELAVTRMRAKMGRPPFALAYSYGDGVLGLAATVTSVTRTVLGVLSRVRTASRAVLVVLVVLLALAWNQGTCATTEPSGVCVSPAAHWTTQVDQWIKEKK